MFRTEVFHFLCVRFYLLLLLNIRSDVLLFDEKNIVLNDSTFYSKTAEMWFVKVTCPAKIVPSHIFSSLQENLISLLANNIHAV